MRPRLMPSAFPKRPAPAMPGPLLAASFPAANPAHRLGLYVTLFYLFAIFGRLPDFLFQSLGSGFFLAGTLWLFLVMAIVFSGNLRRSFEAPAGRMLVLLFAWLFVCLPFSSWRSGSLQWIMLPVRMFAIYLGLTCLLTTVDDCRKTMHAIALSFLLILLSLAVFGTTLDGRLLVLEGSFGNANEIAGVIMMIAPLWLFIASSSARARVVRIVAALLVLVSIVVVLKTGSRGGIVVAALLAAMYFWSASLATKLKMVIAVPVLIAGFIASTPAGALARYRTLLTGFAESEAPLDEGAVTSTLARKQLLLQSIRLTLTHPLFGVGPGVYAPAAEDFAKQQNKRTGWQVSHNSYLQVSSEAGLPAFFLYMAILLSCWRSLSRLRKSALASPDAAELANTAHCLRLSLAAFCIYGLFSSVAFEYYFFVWIGLSVALSRAGREALAAAGAAAAAPITPAAALAAHTHRKFHGIR